MPAPATVSLKNRSPGGMITFAILWLGQCVSLIGSGLTSFALGVWVFQRTGSTTQFALVGLFAVLPRVILSPLAGVVVDRWDRRWTMIISDIGAGISTLVVMLLLAVDQLELWHIYLLTGLNAAFGSFQWPAYAAATTLLVSKQNLGRANGMIQFGRAASEILSPALAGVLARVIQLEGVILIDFATFIFALATLMVIRFPRFKASAAGRAKGDAWWQQLTFGWKYISVRPGLLSLLLFFAIVNFLWEMVGALIVPMILSWASSDVLGIIVSIAGGGMLIGSLMMALWGGPKRRINGVLGFEMLSGLCFILIGFRPTFLPVAIGVFLAHLTIAIVFGSNQAIWQSKVELDVQGRVFATQQMIARAAAPLAFLLAGPLADQVFEPLLAAGGALELSVGQFIESGPGRGIGLLFIVMGIIKIGVTMVGHLQPTLRNIEKDLPDATVTL